MDGMTPDQRRWQQIERRLNQVGSMVKGNQNFQADRIADVIEQIDELRQELKRMSERQDAMAEWLKQNVPKKEDSDGSECKASG